MAVIKNLSICSAEMCPWDMTSRPLLYNKIYLIFLLQPIHMKLILAMLDFRNCHRKFSPNLTPRDWK